VPLNGGAEPEGKHKLVLSFLSKGRQSPQMVAIEMELNHESHGKNTGQTGSVGMCGGHMRSDLLCTRSRHVCEVCVFVKLSVKSAPDTTGRITHCASFVLSSSCPTSQPRNPATKKASHVNILNLPY